MSEEKKLFIVWGVLTMINEFCFYRKDKVLRLSASNYTSSNNLLLEVTLIHKLNIARGEGNTLEE